MEAVPVQMRGSLPMGRVLRRRGVFIVSRLHTTRRSVHPVDVKLLGLVPLGRSARLRVLETLSGSPLRISIAFMEIADRISGGASADRVCGFCRTFSSVGSGGFSKFVVANTPMRRVPFRSMSC